MRATRFNRSEIMSQAWMMFQNKFYGFQTFGEALRRAWHYAKREAERLAQVEARKAAEAALLAERLAAKPQSKNEGFYNKFNKTIAREYKNVTFGKNDWRVSYGRRYY